VVLVVGILLAFASSSVIFSGGDSSDVRDCTVGVVLVGCVRGRRSCIACCGICLLWGY